MIKWIKNVLKNRFYKPTPLHFRAAGDSILYGLGTVSIGTIANGNIEVSIALVAVAMVGKFLSNYPIDSSKKDEH